MDGRCGSLHAAGLARSGCEIRIRKRLRAVLPDGIRGPHGVTEMNSKLQTVEDLKRFAEQFRGIMSLTDDLQKLGSIEQAIEETQTLIRTRQEEAFHVQQIIEERKRQL